MGSLQGHSRTPASRSGTAYAAPARSQASPNTVSVSQRLKLPLSMNCLNSSVSSFISDVITRSSALSCSMRAFSRSELRCAFRKALSAATRDGMVSVMS